VFYVARKSVLYALRYGNGNRNPGRGSALTYSIPYTAKKAMQFVILTVGFWSWDVGKCFWKVFGYHFYVSILIVSSMFVFLMSFLFSCIYYLLTDKIVTSFPYSIALHAQHIV